MADYLKDDELGLINRTGQFAQIQDVLDLVVEYGRTVFIVEQDTDDPVERRLEQKLKKVAVVRRYE